MMQLFVALFIEGFHAFVPDYKEQILQPVRGGHEGIKFHHGGRTFDCMHDTENLIYVIYGKTLGFFRFQQDLIELIHKGVCFKQICFKHAVHVVIHRYTPPYLYSNYAYHA